MPEEYRIRFRKRVALTYCYYSSMPIQYVRPDYWVYRKMTVGDLPAEMEVDCRRGPFRVPLAQFIMDWNHSDKPAVLIERAPVYTGGNDLILPAIATVVHALCARDGVELPDWVLEHRATDDVMLFGGNVDSNLGKLIRMSSPPACRYHRVWFDSQLLNRGISCQWPA